MIIDVIRIALIQHPFFAFKVFRLTADFLYQLLAIVMDDPVQAVFLQDLAQFDRRISHARQGHLQEPDIGLTL